MYIDIYVLLTTHLGLVFLLIYLSVFTERSDAPQTMHALCGEAPRAKFRTRDGRIYCTVVAGHSPLDHRTAPHKDKVMNIFIIYIIY